MFVIKDRIRFVISTHGDVIKLTPVPGQELPGFGEVRGEITLTNLPRETVTEWAGKSEAVAELTLPTPV